MDGRTDLADIMQISQDVAESAARLTHCEVALPIENASGSIELALFICLVTEPPAQ